MIINVLKPEIYNRIAAGEVVDRPRSVVKELFENSIDAGATSINIEILSGGMKMIKVTDNGHGIEKNEMHKVFLAHATSKISNVNDLSHISTLGFRGEAIASITSVSKVTVISRTPDSDLGYFMTYENGVKIDEGEKGCAVGTTVIVEDLFKNIPARAKFLKSPKSEEADISTLVSKLILTSPQVSIKLTSNGKNIYTSYGEGLESAIICVYGREILDNLMEISVSMPDINIKGYVNKPAYSKHNKSYQTLSVNGRYIINEEIGYAVFYAFKDYLMTRQYPMFVLSVTIPEDMVDVNVHPGKMEVKFVQADRIRGLIKKAIDDKIKDSLNIPKNIVKPKNIYEDIFDEEPIKLVESNKIVINNNKDDNVEEKSNKNDSSKNKYEYQFDNRSKTSKPKISESPFSAIIKDIKPINVDKFFYNQVVEKNSAIKTEQTKLNDASNVDEAYNKYEAKLDTKTQQSNDNYQESFELSEQDNAKLNIVNKIGKIFNTYLLIQTHNELLLIDQHAAHERILYDKLKSNIDSSVDVQELLLPYVFETTYQETELIENYKDEINNCGFELNELSSNTYVLRSVPACLSQMNLKSFVGELLFNLKSGKLSKSNFIKSTIMQSACKAAVKGDMDLCEQDITYIIEKLGQTSELFCPHGRPIVIRITKTEIEKWFKRIV